MTHLYIGIVIGFVIAMVFDIISSLLPSPDSDDSAKKMSDYECRIKKYLTDNTLHNIASEVSSIEADVDFMNTNYNDNYDYRTYTAMLRQIITNQDKIIKKLGK